MIGPSLSTPEALYEDIQLCKLPPDNVCTLSTPIEVPLQLNVTVGGWIASSVVKVKEIVSFTLARESERSLVLTKVGSGLITGTVVSIIIFVLPLKE